MPERTDVDPRQLAWLAGAMVIACAVIAAIVWFAFAHPSRRAHGFARAPGPRLQTRPTDDLARLRAEEEARLHSYGWVDRKAGSIHIPIERAMEVTAP